MKNLNIKGFTPNSLVDWDGKVSSVIFLGGCNFRCGFCSNKELVLGSERMEDIDFEKVKDYLKKNTDFIDGIVITGGEPTLCNLDEICREIKELNFKIKLDTNGTNPIFLKKLIKNNLVDYIAVDIKGPSYLYPKIVGNVNIKNIEESIRILNESGIDFELRLTLAPFIDKEIRFFNTKEVEDMLSWILNIVDDKNIKVYLQKFVARSKEEMMDERFAVENLNGKMSETPKELLKEIQKIIIKYFPRCKIRNI